MRAAGVVAPLEVASPDDRKADRLKEARRHGTARGLDARRVRDIAESDDGVAESTARAWFQERDAGAADPRQCLEALQGLRVVGVVVEAGIGVRPGSFGIGDEDVAAALNARI